MTRSSRYVRPATVTAGLWLQSRDHDILKAVYRYRYLRSDQLQRLIFGRGARRAAQARLRLLWLHEYLERGFFPYVLDGVHPMPPEARLPIYALGPKGADVLIEDLELWSDKVPVGFPAPISQLTNLHHHLVVTECLVAVTRACAARPDLRLDACDTEGVLWKKLGPAGSPLRRESAGVVPDGFFTIHSPWMKQPTTFYLEVVRAGVKGGNQTLARKFALYVKLLRGGFFARAYGHGHIGGVLVATTSPERAEHFRALAKQLSQGQNLFWFGAYQEKNAAREAVSTLTPEAISAARWRRTDGAAMSIFPAPAPNVTTAPATAAAPAPAITEPARVSG